MIDAAGARGVPLACATVGVKAPEASMKPSEIRAELLEQHAHVRDLMDATQAIAASLRSGARTEADALRLSLAGLADAMQIHPDGAAPIVLAAPVGSRKVMEEVVEHGWDGWDDKVTR